MAANINADDIRVPMAIAQATAFTILSTESLLVYQNHSPSTGLAARQEEGLRALLRLVVSMESIVTSHEVRISTFYFCHAHFTDNFLILLGHEKLRFTPFADGTQTWKYINTGY